VELVELKRNFNKLNKRRKSLFSRIEKIEDILVRKEVKKNYSKLKNIFENYKQNKDLLNVTIIEKLSDNLEKFEKYLENKIV